MPNYNEILNKWSERVFKEVDKVQLELLPNVDQDKNVYRFGYLNGYVQGLLMATSFLSLIEKKEKHNKNLCTHGFEDWNDCPDCGH